MRIRGLPNGKSLKAISLETVREIRDTRSEIGKLDF